MAAIHSSMAQNVHLAKVVRDQDENENHTTFNLFLKIVYFGRIMPVSEGNPNQNLNITWPTLTKHCLQLPYDKQNLYIWHRIIGSCEPTKNTNLCRFCLKFSHIMHVFLEITFLEI